MIDKLELEMFKVQQGVVQAEVIAWDDQTATKMGFVFALGTHPEVMEATQTFEKAVLAVYAKMGVTAKSIIQS